MANEEKKVTKEELEKMVNIKISKRTEKALIRDMKRAERAAASGKEGKTGFHPIKWVKEHKTGLIAGAATGVAVTGGTIIGAITLLNKNKADDAIDVQYEEIPEETGTEAEYPEE